MKKINLILSIALLLLLLIAACQKATAYSYKIDSDGCIACGKCFEACPHNAIIYQGDKAFIVQSKCTACGQCVSVCPENSIH
ncbi:MAG: 4Fe-4S binding protein [Candidatus Cloacimonetes bacterium]|nr:4Fe-4S binding protein [Candidatus Cloacimonadota bacterium]